MPGPAERDPKKYFSVLVKWDPVRKEEVEIYRVELPGPVKLGEGKPENQNHALIFTRGDAVQTIDMNQVMGPNLTVCTLHGLNLERPDLIMIGV